MFYIYRYSDNTARGPFENREKAHFFASKYSITDYHVYSDAKMQRDHIDATDIIVELKYY